MWHDIEKLKVKANPSDILSDAPKKRWGHCSVAVMGKMYIIGGYQGNQQ